MSRKIDGVDTVRIERRELVAEFTLDRYAPGPNAINVAFMHIAEYLTEHVDGRNPMTLEFTLDNDIYRVAVTPNSTE